MRLNDDDDDENWKMNELVNVQSNVPCFQSILQFLFLFPLWIFHFFFYLKVVMEVLVGGMTISMHNDHKYHKSRHPNIDYNGYWFDDEIERLIVYYEIYGYDENVTENGNDNCTYDRRKIQLTVNLMDDNLLVQRYFYYRW